MCCYAFGQTDSAVAEKEQQVSWAKNAVDILQGHLKDPTSLTVFQVLAISTPRRYKKRDVTWYLGCIHYMATNSYGGRTQSWIGYDVNLISGNYRVTVGEDNLSQHECPVGKIDTVLDVTDKVLDQASGK